MKRRKFLTVITLGVIGITPLLFSESSLKRKMKDVLASVLHFLKPSYNPPQEGKHISVEMALNSRCTSDYDGNPEKYHWGVFDKTRKLSNEQINKIVALARIPRFSDRKVEIQCMHNMLTFVADNRASGLQRNQMMVESGMQQQAVGLVCAALGVGMLFRNLGKDGTSISDIDYGIVKIRLDPMKPTYHGSFWSNLAPADRNPWLRGNLPDPARDGGKPLLTTLANLRTHNTGARQSTEQSISQLLWAARGRTPHLYKSKPWGMTIPTWRGEQNISTLYLLSKEKLYKYLNWDKDRPTHSLLELGEVNGELLNIMRTEFCLKNAFIILGKNEAFSKALWEVGYQLLNLLVQANSLDISYHALLLNETQKSIIASTGAKDPVAILAI